MKRLDRNYISIKNKINVYKREKKMKMIHCTQKLLKELKGTVSDSSDISVDNSGLGNWCSDIFSFNRKKYIIFTNELTLYTFFVYSINKHDLESISSLFKDNLILYLKTFQIEDIIIDKIMKEYGDIGFCKTHTCTVAESMDYFIKIFESRLEFIDEITDREIMIANMQVNTTPMPVLNYASPLKQIKELIMKKYTGM